MIDRASSSLSCEEPNQVPNGRHLLTLQPIQPLPLSLLKLLSILMMAAVQLITSAENEASECTPCIRQIPICGVNYSSLKLKQMDVM